MFCGTLSNCRERGNFVSFSVQKPDSLNKLVAVALILPINSTSIGFKKSISSFSKLILAVQVQKKKKHLYFCSFFFNLLSVSTRKKYFEWEINSRKRQKGILAQKLTLTTLLTVFLLTQGFFMVLLLTIIYHIMSYHCSQVIIGPSLVVMFWLSFTGAFLLFFFSFFTNRVLQFSSQCGFSKVLFRLKISS